MNAMKLDQGNGRGKILVLSQAINEYQFDMFHYGGIIFGVDTKAFSVILGRNFFMYH